MTWHVLIDGEQKGPFEADTVVRMIGRNEVTADTMIWSAGISDWTRAIEVPDFADLFDADAPPARPLQYGAAETDYEDDGSGKLKFGRAFSDAFGGLAAHPGNSVVIVAVYTALTLAISLPYFILVAPKVQQFMESPDQFDGAAFGLADLGAYLLMAIAGMALFGGLCATMLGLIRQENVTVGRLLTGIPRLPSIIGYAIIYFVLCAIGTVLLVLPGIFLMVALMLGMFVIMDRGAGPLAATKGSYRAVLGLGWFRVFGLLLLLFIAIFAIFLVLGLVVGFSVGMQGGLSEEAAVDGAMMTQSLIFYVIQSLISSVIGVFFVAILAASYEQAAAHLDSP
jgi:hypothetical protein